MTTERQPQPGDLYAYREDGAVLFIPREQQLTRWRGGNPFEQRSRKPLGKSPDQLHRILNDKKAKKA